MPSGRRIAAARIGGVCRPVALSADGGCPVSQSNFWFSWTGNVLNSAFDQVSLMNVDGSEVSVLDVDIWELRYDSSVIDDRVKIYIEGHAAVVMYSDTFTYPCDIFDFEMTTDLGAYPVELSE